MFPIVNLALRMIVVPWFVGEDLSCVGGDHCICHKSSFDSLPNHIIKIWRVIMKLYRLKNKNTSSWAIGDTCNGKAIPMLVDSYG